MTPAAAFDAFEASGWEAAAAGYDRFFAPITARLIEPLLDAADVSDGTRILDVACGPGALTAQAAQRGAKATGIDVADAMLTIARSRHPGVNFRRADACRLPYPNAHFDAVVANFAILHLGDPPRAITEFARVLTPTGRIAVTTWDQPDRARIFGWVLQALATAGAAPPSNIPAGPPFFRYASDTELTALLHTGGFEHVTTQTMTFTAHAGSVDEIWDGIVAGTVRTAALIRNQPEPTQQAIRAAFERLVAASTHHGTIEIPFSVRLASAHTST